jgi:hypothetical protein
MPPTAARLTDLPSLRDEQPLQDDQRPPLRGEQVLIRAAPVASKDCCKYVTGAVRATA